MIEKTSDRVNVVRCSSCVFCYIKDMATGTCDNRFGLSGIVQPSDFCSRGKTREQIQKQEERRL